MSYDAIDSLDNLDVGSPTSYETLEEVAASVRQLKAIVRNVILQEHTARGVTKQADLVNTLIGLIDSDQIKNHAVTESKIAPKAVSSEKIADGALVERLFVSDSIPGTSLKAGTVPLTALASVINATALGSSASEDGLRAVGADHIKTNAVTDRTIANVNVSKLIGGPTVDSLLLKVNGTWQAVELLSGGALSFDNTTGLLKLDTLLKVCVFGDIKAGSTVGGNVATANVWTRREIGNIFDSHNIASFSNNKITLPVGNYIGIAFVPGHAVGGHQARLVQHTTVDSVETMTEVSVGSSAYSAAGVTTTSILLFGLNIVGEAGTYSIEHIMRTVGTGSTELGNAVSTTVEGRTEMYTMGVVLKVG